MYHPGHPSASPSGAPTPPSNPRTTKLLTSIPPINHKIRPRSERTSITRQIQIHPFQLPRIRIPFQWRQAIPLLLHRTRTIAANSCIDVPRADAVYAREGGEFYGEGFGEVDYPGFAGVVAGLLR